MHTIERANETPRDAEVRITPGNPKSTVLRNLVGRGSQVRSRRPRKRADILPARPVWLPHAWSW